MTRIYAIFLSVILMLIIASLFFPGQQIIKAIALLTAFGMFFFMKQEYLVYFMVFALFFSFPIRYFGNMTNAIILMALFVLIIKHVSEKEKVLNMELVKRNPFLICSIILLVCYLISLVIALDKNLPIGPHADFMLGICCMFLFGCTLIAFVDSRIKLRRVGKVLLIVLMLNLLFGIITLIDLDFVLISYYFESKSFIGGFGENRALRLAGLNFRLESYGEYLMVAIIGLFGVITNFNMKKRYKGLLGMLLIIAAFQLLLNNTRGSIISTMVGILIMVLINRKRSFMKKMAVVAAAASIFFVSLLAAEMTGYLRIKERLSTLTEVEQTKYGNLPKARAKAWVPSIDKVVKDGFIGSGPSLYPYTQYALNEGELVWPHNIILLILATVGIYGLCAYLYLYYKMIKTSLKISKIYNENVKWFFYSLAVAIIALTIDSMKYDGFLRKPSPFFYFIWLILILFMCAGNFVGNKNNNNKSD